MVVTHKADTCSSLGYLSNLSSLKSVSYFADECIRQKVYRKCDQLPFEVDFILRSMLVALLVHAAGGGRVVSRVRQQRDLSHLVNIPLGA